MPTGNPIGFAHSLRVIIEATAAPAPALPATSRNLRRDKKLIAISPLISLLPLAFPLRSNLLHQLPTRLHPNLTPIRKRRKKQQQNHARAHRRNQPDRGPVMRSSASRIVLHHRPRQPRANKHPHPVSKKSDEPLRRGSQLLVRLAIDINLPSHKEEV